VLRRVRWEEIERLTPRGEFGARVTRLLRLGGCGRQVLQLVDVDQPVAGRAGKQRGGYLGTALRTDGWRRSCRHSVNHREA